MLAMEHEFEAMMIAMQRKKLLDDGEYFLIGVDSKPYDPSDPQVYIEGWHLTLQMLNRVTIKIRLHTA